MTTVPTPDTPAPANNAQTKLVSDSMSGNYGRPASGGPPVAGKSEGNAPTNPPTADKVPGAEAYNPQPYRGNVPGTSGTMVGPDFGHGATEVMPQSGDRPSGGDQAYDMDNPGTVGDSGDQGAGPGAAGFTETGRENG